MVTLPGEREMAAVLAARREQVWRDLGEDARSRYATCTSSWQQVGIAAPNHHLNMIGVRRAQAGTGLARPLLETVQRLAEADPASAGVTLTTENRQNISFYEYFGYRVVGQATIAPGLETWGFYRPRS
jgi:ribosomal protein S18 acetylase RimI-like enzyme